MKRHFASGCIVAVGALVLFLSNRHSAETKADKATEVVSKLAAAGDTKIERQAASVPIPGLPPTPPAARKVLRPADQRWTTPTTKQAFAKFGNWATRYAAENSASEKLRLESEGVELARVRHQAMREMIQTDPEQALELSVPRSLRKRLPDSVAALIEEQVDGRGDFGVLAAIPAADHSGPFDPVYRTVSIDDQGWRAYTFGDALNRTTTTDIPLHGIALDNLFALDPNAVRILEADEVAALSKAKDALCAVSGKSAAEFGEETAVDAGGHTAWLCSAAHTENYNEQLILASIDRGNGTDADGVFRQKSAYTEGIKRLLMIRVDFSDLAGVPFSNTAGTNMLAGIDAFYREQSYGKTGFRPLTNGSAMTATLRMPKTAAVYGASDAAILRTDARNAAQAAGVNLSNFDFDLICFGAVPGFNWAGLGYVGAPGAWIRAAFDATGGVPSHELGHNFGLNHANFWDTGGQSIVGAGSNVEYGDSFDTMGNATAGKRHFNARYKNYLNWMPTAQVRTVGLSGTYRVFTHDVTNTAATRAIRVPRNAQTNYWLEFRQKFTDKPALMNGLGLRWARAGNQQSLLLDMTPGSAGEKDDSPLLIGRTFADPSAGIYITPVAKGGTTPESLDITINIGRFDEDNAPTLSLAASATNVSVNASVTFTATASDPDGDTLAYSWDFGDGGIVAANTNRVSKSWSAIGEYVVRCVASDMKGGVASSLVVVRVGTPNVVRIAGRITRDGSPVEGVRVEVSNTKQTFTDSQGNYVISGLARGSYTVKAVADGLLFTRSGFVNPLSVQSNLLNINFNASLPGDLTLVTLVPMGAQWRFYDQGNLSGGATWRTTNYNDSTWSAGAAPLGYGDDNIVTTVGYGPSETARYITTWFRHSFTVDDPSVFASATLGLIRDDGAAVYLNGREVFRSNLPTGTLASGTRASASVGGTDETTVFETDIDPALFVRGTNTFAVEVHQYAPDSSDLRFALRVSGLLRPAAEAPKLAFNSSPDQIRLAWPLTAVGYVLQEADSPASAWQPSEETVGTEAGQNFTTITVTNSARFYRLTRQ